ncbi:uncharacterized protein LOC114870526 isoform X2 [Betta splendens]|nr:uncharacterized protein LOC114870526 isoform X2 [Betta splendens]XP_055358293.1 uncharacterized protein LOC114870526 isoform X2 [Betta splendens]
MVATDVRGLHPAASARASAHRRTPVTHSSLLGETLTRSATFHGLTQATAQRQEEGSPRQRRITVASYMPQPRDQNGNFPEKDADERATKPLRELSTDGLCRWFTSIGLERCLPFIREAKLCGADIASVDANTLDILHVTTLEDREQLLSAIYAELHPPSTTSQRLDSLLETLGPNHVETFAATLVSMSKSRSSPHVSCLSLNRRSLKVRNNSQSCNTQLIEVTVTASERIVHLRTPKETTVGKIMDSCIKMLGATEDKCLFTLREKHSSLEELMPDQQVGGLLTSASDNAQVELLLCKLEKPASPDSSKSPDVDSANENGSSDTTLQSDKEKRIRELKQQVDSLQNVILQVQELHLSLVAFCSELKSMDGDVNADELGADELQRRLELVQSRVSDKKQSLRTLRDHISRSAAHKTNQLEVHLLEKMKLNCQVFKEEISLVHLNRQVAQLQSALDESTAKEKSPAVCSLGQLVSPRRPAMLLVVQEKRRPGGHYGFTCRYREGGGLVVVEVDDSHLCVDDRLVEVNGTLVVNWTQEELTQHLLQGPSAQVVVLRQPPPTGLSQQQPPLPQHMVHPGPAKTACQEQDQVAMATPPRRRLMAI